MKDEKRRRRIGVVIAAVWTLVIVALAVVLHDVFVLVFLGLLGVILFPFRQRDSR